jgi:hypothetical protein
LRIFRLFLFVSEVKFVEVVAKVKLVVHLVKNIGLFFVFDGSAVLIIVDLFVSLFFFGEEVVRELA